MVKTESSGTIFKIKRFSLHDGPGIRTTVFLKGCPLRCAWCHSPEGIAPDITVWHNSNICISCRRCIESCPADALSYSEINRRNILINRALCKLSGDCVDVCPAGALDYTGTVTNVTKIIDEVKKDIQFYVASGGGMTLSGGEPLFQPGFTLSIMEEARKLGIHTAMETSLFCDTAILKHIADLTDLFIVDLKIFSDIDHQRFTGKSNKLILSNFRNLAKMKEQIIVRIPLIPGITDTDANLSQIKEFTASCRPDIPVEMISYNPLTPNNYGRLDMPFALTDIH